MRGQCLTCLLVFLNNSFETFQLGDAKLNIYDGGSAKNKDTMLYFLTGNNVLTPITSSRNQIFITFNTDHHGVGKGFTAKITFGNRTNHYIIIILQQNIYFQFEE